MTKEEKLKGVLLKMFDIAKLSDSIEGFNKLNKESCSERLFRACKANDLDIKEVLGMDYLEPTEFKDSVWGS